MTRQHDVARRRSRRWLPTVPMATRGACLTAVAIGLLPVYFLGAAFVSIARDTGMSAVGLGRATAVVFVAAAPSSALGRAFIARIGSPSTLRVGCGLVALGLGLLPLLASEAGVLAAMLVVGVGNGLIQPAAIVGVASASKPESIGYAFGLQQTAVPISAALAGVSIPVLVVQFGWESAAIVLAALVLALVVLGDLGGSHDAPAAESNRVNPSPAPQRRDVAGAMGMTFAAAAGSVLGTFLVDTLVDRGLRESRAALLMTGGSVVAIVVRLLAGRAFDRSATFARHGLSWLLAASALAVIALANSRSTGALIASTGLVFATVWGWPGVLHARIVTTSVDLPRAAARAHSSLFLGAFLGPLVFGFVSDRSGYSAAWWTAAAWCAVAATATAVGVSASRPPLTSP